MSSGNNYHDEEVLGKAYDARLMKRLLTYIHPYRRLVVIAVILLLLGSLVQISFAFITQIAIDDYIAAGDHTGLVRLVLVFLLAVGLSFGASYAQLYITAWLGQQVLHDIRMQVFSHLQKLRLSYFDRNPVGRLVTRVTSDVNVLNEMFSSGVITVVGDLFMLALIVGALLYYNWRLALITFMVLPLLVGATFLFRAKVRRVYREVRTRIAQLNAFVQEHIGGIKLLQLFVRENRTYDRFDKINHDLQSVHHRGIYYYAIFFPAVEIISALSLALLLYYGGVRINDATMTFGELVAFIHLVERFYRPIRDLSEKYNILQASMASSERIFALLDTEPAPTEGKNVSKFTGRIEFENVWFAYNSEQWVLKDVSFTVEPGEKVAIVGATGAGKTSLMSLLYRFYDYQRGAIRLDGLQLPDWSRERLRSHLGLVLQDVFVFAGDIADNVRLRDESITDEVVRESLSRVGFDRFLKDLPDGIHTKVQERGATLSTGQKQLLSFARALAHDPDVLILDEATSSVDTETELLIQKALDELLKNRTSIVIAHRLSTIEKADKIVVLHHGEVRQIGPHAELVKQPGIYQTLYQMQYQKSERPPSTPVR